MILHGTTRLENLCHNNILTIEWGGSERAPGEIRGSRGLFFYKLKTSVIVPDFRASVNQVSIWLFFSYYSC
jgi:hypothetical protein